MVVQFVMAKDTLGDLDKSFYNIGCIHNGLDHVLIPNNSFPQVIQQIKYSNEVSMMVNIKHFQFELECIMGTSVYVQTKGNGSKTRYSRIIIHTRVYRTRMDINLYKMFADRKFIKIAKTSSRIPKIPLLVHAMY